MRVAVVACALVLAAVPGPAAAQDGWPWSSFPSLMKQAKPAPKRGQPRAAPKAEAAAAEAGQPAATTAALDAQQVHPPGPEAPASAPPPAPPESAAGEAAGPASDKAAPPPWAWRILRTAWTERDETGYEEFVRRIGESGCRGVHACLTGADSNPLYRASNPAGMTFYADCADLPYVLRAYYAWKNGLPFSYSTAVTPLGASHDIRYTARGNAVSARRDLVEPGLDARKVLPAIAGTITSAHYRHPPDHAGRLLPDHYPVRISRDSIKPGTIVYDPNGHVAVVYKVTAEGRIHYIDTHPDNSLTRGVYGKAFARSSPAMGAGFKRWRPLALVGATQRPDGSWQGGRIVLAPDKDIPGWSDEQFFGTATPRPKTWSAGRFVLDGQTLDYYDYLRRRLARAGFRYDPLEETRAMVRALCEDLKYRVDAVDIAVKAGMDKRPQPDRLPANIYGTDGDWETYSTPSRDARLKTAFKELRDEVARFLELGRQGSAELAYAGGDLAGDIRRAYLAEAGACSIAYRRSDGSERRLSFADVKRRLFRLSFDPYHCVERRWGAEDGEELATCGDGPDKRAWYEAQQRLRNQPDRTYEVRMGFTLADLRRRAPGSGIDAPPDVDVLALVGAEPPAAAETAKTYVPAGEAASAVGPAR